jgi:selenoprotein W-related protein
VSAVADLLRDYQHVIEELRVVTGSKGIFDVRVDGELIFSKYQLDRHAEPGEVHRLFAAHIDPKIEIYER